MNVVGFSHASTPFANFTTVIPTSGSSRFDVTAAGFGLFSTSSRVVDVSLHGVTEDASADASVLSRCVFGTMIWTYNWYRPGRDDPDTVAAGCAEFALRGVTGGD